MKLIIAIVNNDDSGVVSSSLLKAGFFSTKLSTTGGLLKKGNTTFLIGTDDDKVEEAVSIIKKYSRKRTELTPTLPAMETSEMFTPILAEVTVGGATVFVVDIEKFEKM